MPRKSPYIDLVRKTGPELDVTITSCVLGRNTLLGKKGTRIASAATPVNFGSRSASFMFSAGGPSDTYCYTRAMRKAEHYAIGEWVSRWGQLPWNKAEIVSTATDADVSVEVRVPPDGD